MDSNHFYMRHRISSYSNILRTLFVLVFSYSPYFLTQVPRYFVTKILSLVENKGFEPLTPCVQGRCSSQLS